MNMGSQQEQTDLTQDERNAHKIEVTELLKQPLQKGDIWYLVDEKWYRVWKSYFGIGYNYQHDTNSSQHPGEIDNLNLFIGTGESAKLRPHLLEDMDYQLVPEPVWDKLVCTCGMKEDQPIFPRKVIESGLYVKNLSVEIYLLDLTLQKYNDRTKSHTKEFSKVVTVGELYEEFISLFEVPSNKIIRLFTDNNDCLDKKEETLMDSGIRHSQTIFMQEQNDDGTWSTISSVSSTKSKGTSFTNGYSLRNSSNHSVENDDSEKGLCGLSNLGNTCFMNSAIQCLSNVPSLTKYFLNNEHKNDLNRDNPLGMKGKIALAYAKLIKEIWSGTHSSVSPREFKSNVGAFAPRFSGYQQHDSQELLAFLIDGLHEDLNKIIKKPYVELHDADGRPDEVVAEEAWKNHSKRNSSIIVDIFHGLFKSTLVCPTCSRISITFDPFCFLSLPLPVETETLLPCHFVSNDPTKPVEKHQVSVYKTGTMAQFREELSKQTGVHPAFIKVADVYNSRFYKVFSDTYTLRSVSDRDALYAYDMTINGEQKNYTTAKVCIRRHETYSNKLMGHPFLIALPENATYQTLYKAVLRALKRYIKQKHWEEVEVCEDWQKCDINEDDSAGEHSERESDEDDEQDKGVKKSRLDRLFKLSVINSYGSTTIKSIEDDDNPLKISDDVYYSADWDANAWSKYMVDDWDETTVMHTSAEKTLKKKTGIKLDACMKLFTSTEVLGEDDLWYCPSCEDHKQATKKFDIWSLPPVLIIHLKRFSYSRWSRDKIDALVDFPVTNLDMSEFIINPIKDKCPKEKYTYNLIGVANHYGGMGGGHYTAYAKNFNTNQWHYFDDSSVSNATEARVVTKAAYMLFYQRQDLEKFHTVAEGNQYVIPPHHAISPRGFHAEFDYDNSNGSSVDEMDTS